MSDIVLDDGTIMSDVEDADTDSYEDIPTDPMDEDNVIDEEDGGEQPAPPDEPDMNVADIDAVVSVKDGDDVIVTLIDGVPVVTGVVGWGDAVEEDVAKAKTAADTAREYADDAKTYADDAKTYAGNALDRVQEAERSVVIIRQRVADVETLAGQAKTSAGEAKASADRAVGYATQAQTSANAATFALSDLENVLGMIGWLEDHGGEYVPTADTHVVPRKAYYRRGVTEQNLAGFFSIPFDDTDYWGYLQETGTQDGDGWLSTPNGSGLSYINQGMLELPAEGGTYTLLIECEDGDAQLGTVASFSYSSALRPSLPGLDAVNLQDGEHHFEFTYSPGAYGNDFGWQIVSPGRVRLSLYEAGYTGGYIPWGQQPEPDWVLIEHPTDADIASYYELSLEESVRDYISSHLWMDRYGLNLTVDSATGWRIHQGTVDGTKAMGVYILDPNGVVAGRFTAVGVTVGNESEWHSVMSPTGMAIKFAKADAFNVAAPNVVTNIGTGGKAEALSSVIAGGASGGYYRIPVDGACGVGRPSLSQGLPLYPQGYYDLIEALEDYVADRPPAMIEPSEWPEWASLDTDAREVLVDVDTIDEYYAEHGNGYLGVYIEYPGGVSLDGGRLEMVGEVCATGAGGDLHCLTQKADRVHTHEYMPIAGSTESGSDLNDQADGEIWWGNGFGNAPDDLAGYFRVLRQAGTQLAYYFAGNAQPPQVYARSYTNGVWQPWARVDSLGSVRKSGDTMTGALTISGKSAFVKSTNLDRDGAVPSANAYGQSFQLTDKDNERMGYIQAATYTDGTQWMRLVATGDVNGSSVDKAFAVGVTREGAAKYATSDAAAFRNALGASSGVWTAAMIPALAASKITSGTFDAARIPTLAATKVTPIYYQARGSGNLALTANTMTQVALVTTGALSSGSGLSIASGGIKIATAGRYRISASAYITATGASLQNRQVFVRRGANSAAWSSATEVMSATDHFWNAASGAVNISPFILQCAANDIIYLIVRTQTGAGTVYRDNAATYLLVERLS